MNPPGKGSAARALPAPGRVPCRRNEPHPFPPQPWKAPAELPTLRTTPPTATTTCTLPTECDHPPPSMLGPPRAALVPSRAAPPPPPPRALWRGSQAVQLLNSRLFLHSVFLASGLVSFASRLPALQAERGRGPREVNWGQTPSSGRHPPPARGRGVEQDDLGGSLPNPNPSVILCDDERS